MILLEYKGQHNLLLPKFWESVFLESSLQDEYLQALKSCQWFGVQVSSPSPSALRGAAIQDK